MQLRLEGAGLGHVVLHPVGRPAGVGGRVAVGAAGVDAHRQPVLLAGGEQRPVGAAAERRLAHGQEQHLHEAPVGRQPLDLAQRELHVVRRQQDRGAQPRLGVQQLLGHPVVDGRAQGRRHVVVEQRHRAVQRVADGIAEPEAVEHVRADRLQARRAGLPGAGRQSGRADKGEVGG